MARPERWAETTIGAICSLTNGMVFKPSDWSEAGLPIVRIQNLNNPDAPFNYYDGPVEDRFLIKNGDLVFAWSGTPGTSFGAHIWHGPDAVLNQHIFKLDFDRSGVDPNYFRYAINQTLDEQMSKAHGGVGLRHVTRHAFSSTSLPLPPFGEQVRLADTVAKLRTQVSKCRNGLLDISRLVPTARQAVLQAAFDGDLTRSWRSSNQAIETVEQLLARVPAPEQGQGGRKATTRLIQGRAGISVNAPNVTLPDGWRWISLLRLARQETGHTPSRRNPEYWDGDIDWLGIKDASAHHGSLVTSTLQRITPEGLKNSSARLLPTGTVCLSRTASVGYVTILGAEMATSQDFATWTCGGALLPEYLMYALMSEGPAIKRFGGGSVHTTIYFPEIRAFHIRLAPLAEQAAIISAIRHAFSKIDQIILGADKSVRLTEMLERQIMTRAFQGSLTGPEPGDGSAADLLSRLRPPVISQGSRSQGAKSKRKPTMVKSLQQVLQDASDWLPAQEVFRRCGIASGADTDTIEQVYAELRVIDQAKRLLVKPIVDSKGRKVQDCIRLASDVDAIG